MQELLNSFGVNGFLFIAQVVNFLIVLFLLKQFALGPILKLLQDRKKTITESLTNAEETKKLLEKTEQKEKEVLKKAQTQAQEIISDAKKQSSILQSEAEVKAKERVEKIIVDAQKKIEDQTKIAEKQLATQVTKLSVEVIEKALKGFFDEKEQKSVVEKAVKRIKA